ncbi:MAG: hypothetical protein PVF68_02265 [Acidobacteriota bacterium]|jgi:hypothetical protein
MARLPRFAVWLDRVWWTLLAATFLLMVVFVATPTEHFGWTDRPGLAVVFILAEQILTLPLIVASTALGSMARRRARR